MLVLLLRAKRRGPHTPELPCGGRNRSLRQVGVRGVQVLVSQRVEGTLPLGGTILANLKVEARDRSTGPQNVLLLSIPF